MITPRSPHDINALLAHWAQVDDEAGRTAAARRHHMLRASGHAVQDYEFHEMPNDWVHRDWMRPVRFIYRNIPKALRMQMKKRLVK